MEEAPKTAPPQPNLTELASKSWNLELIISGAAVFFTLEIPGVLDELLHFYL